MTTIAVLLILAALSACGLSVINAWLIRRSHAMEQHLPPRFLQRNVLGIMLIPLIATVLLTAALGIYTTLANPTTASTLIHTFTWLLALSGISFTVQAVAAYAYHAGADILDRRQMRIVAYVHAASSWIPVISIAALISFSVTPGTWLTTYTFGDALINPTFIPTLILISIGALCLGSTLLALMTHLNEGFTADEKRDLEKLCRRPLWVLVIIVPLAPLLFMILPEGTGATPFLAGGIACLALFASLAIISSKTGGLGLTGSFAATMVLVAAGTCFYSFQTTARTPYTIAGYIYSNDIAVADLPRLKREGLLSHAHWLVPQGADITTLPEHERGHWVYEAMGYGRYPAIELRRLSATIAGWNDERARNYVVGILIDPQRVPPFAGTPRELDDLIDYLIRAAGGKRDR